jgi:hypothetical protein
MDLDFGLPPSLQRGAEILLSEGLYTLWTARNEVIFERRQHDGLSVRDLAIRRIKVRLKAEWKLQGPSQFQDLWQHNTTGGGKITKAILFFYFEPLHTAHIIHWENRRLVYRLPPRFKLLGEACSPLP